MNAIITEWVGIFVSIFIPTIGGVIWIISTSIGNVNQKLERNQKHLEIKIAELEDELKQEIKDEIQKQSSADNYHAKEVENNLRHEINQINHLIQNIEQRFIDRSNLARMKWQNVNKILNNIIGFMEKKGYIFRDLPLEGADKTLTDGDDITGIY